jgi:hypothetical protein
MRISEKGNTNQSSSESDLGHGFLCLSRGYRLGCSDNARGLTYNPLECVFEHTNARTRTQDGTGMAGIE